jgi:hypothetical protein
MEEQVLKAEALGGDDNLILRELSALISAYTGECAKLAYEEKDLDSVLKKLPCCPMEKIALGMVAAAVHEIRQAKSEQAA